MQSIVDIVALLCCVRFAECEYQHARLLIVELMKLKISTHIIYSEANEAMASGRQGFREEGGGRQGFGGGVGAGSGPKDN